MISLPKIPRVGQNRIYIHRMWPYIWWFPCLKIPRVGQNRIYIHRMWPYIWWFPCQKYLGLARTVYIHRMWPYIWWFPCQTYRTCTVCVWYWLTLCMCVWQDVHGEARARGLTPLRLDTVQIWCPQASAAVWGLSGIYDPDKPLLFTRHRPKFSPEIFFSNILLCTSTQISCQKFFRSLWRSELVSIA